MNDTTTHALGRFTLLAGIPVFLILDFWMVYGPGLYGVYGWGAVLTLFIFTPCLLVWMGIVFALAFCNPRRPRAFTIGQTVVTWLLWGTMAVIGATLADAGDNGGGVSVFMHFFGQDTATTDLSGSLFGIAVFAMMLGGLALPIMVLVDLVVASRERSAQVAQGHVAPPR